MNQTNTQNAYANNKKKKQKNKNKKTKTDRDIIPVAYLLSNIDIVVIILKKTYHSKQTKN